MEREMGEREGEPHLEMRTCSRFVRGYNMSMPVAGLKAWSLRFLFILSHRAIT